MVDAAGVIEQAKKPAAIGVMIAGNSVAAIVAARNTQSSDSSGSSALRSSAGRRARQ